MQENLQVERESAVLDPEVLRRAMEDPGGRPVVINGVPGAGMPQEEDKGSGIKSAVFLITFVGAILGAIVFSQIEPLLCVTCIGAVFLVIGTMGALQGRFPDNAPMLIVPLIGLLMTVLPVVALYGRRTGTTLLTVDTVVTIALGVMILVGVGLVVLPPVIHAARLRRCTCTVPAVCIFRTYRFDRSTDARGRSYTRQIYSPVWQYAQDGVVYVTAEGVYGADTPEIGERREILCDPQHPADIYRPQKAARIIPTIIGILFVVLPLVALFVLHTR